MKNRFVQILFLISILLSTSCDSTKECAHTNVLIDEAIEPTCTKHGLSEGNRCADCGKILTAQEIIEPLGHSIVADQRVEPTANQPGLTEGAHCERCGEIIVKQNTINPTGYKLTAIPNNNLYGTISGELNQTLFENDKSSPVTAIPNLGYKFTSWSNGVTDKTISLSVNCDTIIVANFEIDNLELPVMNIHTDNKAPIVSKEDYIKCGISVSNTDYKYGFNNLMGKIKGRGNSTWEMPKKPYKLKFDKKIDLFGNGSSKTWTLIANYCDPSMSRNFLAYKIGEYLESDFCTTTQFIDLYLNDEYQGVYLICEQNEVGKNRVDIDESYDDVDTGYLIEMNLRAEYEDGVENIDWFRLHDRIYEVKSPDTKNEKYNEQYTSYIKDYLTDTMNAIVSNDIEKINDLIDLESFAKSYIVHELTKAIDLHGLSFYIYKDKGGVLKSGPIWDFDISSGNSNYVNNNYLGLDSANYDVLYAFGSNIWYYKLLQLDEFKTIVSSMLAEKTAGIVKVINDSIDELYGYSKSFNRNFDKWQTLGTYVWPNPDELVEITTWEGQVEYLKGWLLKSLVYVSHFYTIE